MSHRYLIIAMDMSSSPPGTVFKTLVQAMKAYAQIDIVSPRFDESLDWSNIGTFVAPGYYDHSWHTITQLWKYLHINHHDVLWTRKAFHTVWPQIKSQKYNAVLTFTSMNNFPAITLGEKIAKRMGLKWYIYSVDAIPAPLEWLDGDTRTHSRMGAWLHKHCKSASGFFSSNPYMMQYQRSTFNHCRGWWDYLLTPHLQSYASYPSATHKGIVFMYTGSLYGLRRIDGLLEGFLAFREKHPDAKLLFVGNIAIDYILQTKELTEQGIVEIHPFSKDLSGYFRQADVLIDIAADIPNDVYLSSKFISYLSIDRPILAISGSNSPVRNLFGNIPSIVHCANNGQEVLQSMEACVAVMGKGIEDRNAIREEVKADTIAKKLLSRINPPQRILISAQPNIASTTGGSIAVFNLFCNMLARNGYEVYASCHSQDPQRPAALDPQVHFINSHLHYPDYPDYHKGFNRVVEELHPSLIVYFFPHYILETRLAKKYNNIPRILMFHSAPDYLFGQLEHFREKLKKYYINTCAQVLLESHRNQLPDYIKNGALVVIPNAVEQFTSQVNYQEEHRKMVFFSRVDRMKGVDLLIDAFALVAQKYPNWSIDIYGDIEPSEYAVQLKQSIHEKSLDSNIFFKGVTHDKERVLTSYDFCVFPSRVEGFGLGLTESMSAGLACIGLQSCMAVNEIIKDGKNGLLCQDTPESLAQAILRLIEHPEQRAAMGAEARKSTREFAPEKVEQAWLSLIQNILSGQMKL